MNLTAKLALSQLQKARKRTMWTLMGIAISVGMIVAVNGFAASAMEMFTRGGRTLHIWERTGFLVIAAVLGGIIAIASIIVISNAFRVSATERTRQFGILKSVGATGKQITSTVMYEAVFLSVVGLPLGVFVGLFAQFVATILVNRVLGDSTHLFPAWVNNVYFPFTISFLAIGIAAIGAFVIILISAWIPAIKAARAPVVSSFAGDAKVVKPRRHGLARLLFGFEGQLAAGQLRRSRRSFRASVISLTISIVILLAAASAHSNLLRQIDMMYENVDANALVSVWTLLSYTSRDPYTEEWSRGLRTDRYGNPLIITREQAHSMTEFLGEFPGANVRGHGFTDYYFTVDGNREHVQLIVLEDELYTAMANQAGVPHGSNILVNVGRETDALGVTREVHPHTHILGTTLDIYRAEYMHAPDGWGLLEIESTRRPLEVHGQVTSLPDVMLNAFLVPLFVIVPEDTMANYSWFVQTYDTMEFLDYAWDMRHNAGILSLEASFSSGNLDIRQAETELIVRLATVFVGGFVAMLALISVTNVISTIATNTKLRVREFAILASVGMTRGGIGKMLALESVLCSIRALLFGLPLGALAAFGVFRGTQMDRVRFAFVFPWEALVVCIVGVFVLTLATTMFSAFRLRGENIIEAVR